MSGLDLDHLSRCYGRTFRTVERVAAGGHRIHCLTTESDIFYLKLYRPDAETGFALRLLRAFPPTHGVAVARPVAAISGADLVPVTVEGEGWNACLFEALAGRSLARTTGDMRRFGTAIADLQRGLAAIAGEDVLRLHPLALCARADRALAHIAGSDAVRAAIDRHGTVPFGDPGFPPLPSGICHGDAWAGNVVAQEKSVGFLDFDDCGWGPSLLDLGTAVRHLVVSEGGWADESVAALVAGYEAVRPLTDDERRMLPLFVNLAEIRSLLFLAERCILEPDLWSRVFDRAITCLGGGSDVRSI